MEELSSFISRYHTLLKDKAENSRALKAAKLNERIAPEIVESGKEFLNKLLPAAKRVAFKFDTDFEVKDGRLYVIDEERSLPYALSNAVEIAKEAVKTINETLTSILREGTDSKSLVRLGVALNTFYAIVDGIEKKEEEDLERLKGEKEATIAKLEEERDAIEQDFQKLESDIHDYFDTLPKDPRDVSVEEGLSILGKRKFSHKIDLGEFDESEVPEDFREYVEGLGHKIEDKKQLCLSCEEGHNFAFLHADYRFLRRNYDLEARLKDLIMRSFLNFETKSFQVAMLESKDAEVMLAPLANLLRAASSDYVITNDTADNEEEASRLISALNDDVRKRLIEFKSNPSFSCRNIEDYNKHNPDNPIRYIFLVIKDYPTYFSSLEMRNKLENIILDGPSAGVMVLLIGENSEIEVSYNRSLPPLELNRGYSITVGEDKNLYIDGKPFQLKPAKKDNHDIDLLAKRYKTSNSFSLDTLLEESSRIPHYEEVAIPLGRAGGDLYSLVAHTEKPPFPFVLVTGGTGTGKSAFMHEIILSGAMKYSPDELEFHVIDFKTTDQSTEFAAYRYGEKMYIPHVRYLSLQSRPENALDIVNYIQKLKSKRNRLGKFEEYNRTHPEKKMPLIYVIIDEYESMLSGGEANSGGDIESITVQMAIQDGVTKIMKTARAFGIGLIFSGQAMNGLPNDAFGQLSTMIAFNNPNNKGIFDRMFGNNAVDLSLFPTDDYRGLAYTASNKGLPRFTKFAWAGNPEKMASLAERIRKKYPEHTARHIQSIIGATDSAEIRLESYLPWQEEIENRLFDAESEYPNKDAFLKSREDRVIKTFRPIALGQSSSSENTVYLDYQKDENGCGFFAFGRNENLTAIERNAMLSFLYQIAGKKLQDRHILFLDGSRFGVKEDLFGPLGDSYPFLFKSIEYLNDHHEMAKALLRLHKHMEEGGDDPYLIVVHETDWLDDPDALPPVKKTEEKKEEAEPVNSDMMSSLSALQGKGIKIPSNLLSADFFAGSQAKAKKEEEFADYSRSDLRNAFKELYLSGSLFGRFMLVSSIRHESLSSDVIGLAKGVKSLQAKISNHAVYGSYEMLKSENVGNGANANICYVLNGESMRSTTRLFDYESPSAKPWWERLEKLMYIWR